MALIVAIATVAIALDQFRASKRWGGHRITSDDAPQEGWGCAGTLTRSDLEATSLHHRADAVSQHRVP
jgi:hypothetical protein